MKLHEMNSLHISSDEHTILVAYCKQHINQLLKLVLFVKHYEPMYH